jgi:hypothetical protein
MRWMGVLLAMLVWASGGAGEVAAEETGSRTVVSEDAASKGTKTFRGVLTSVEAGVQVVRAESSDGTAFEFVVDNRTSIVGAQNRTKRLSELEPGNKVIIRYDGSPTLQARQIDVID